VQVYNSILKPLTVYTCTHLILVIASSTYINLSTARSIERAKEVGIRKVIGAGRRQLFWQFIGESAILSMLSVALGLGVAVSVLPWFNQLTEKQLQVHSLFSPGSIFFTLAVGGAVSLLAGSYPAFILTGFQPVKVLKGSFKNTGSGQALRKSLIVFQFAISVFLIVSTFIMQKQLYYIQHKRLGYDREHTMVLPLSSKMIDHLPLIKQQFKTNPDILSVSRCVSTPVNIAGGYNMRTSLMPENTQLNVTADPVDEDFIKTTGLELIAGEDFSEQDMKDMLPDSNGKRTYHFILNVSAAKELGWTPQEAIGKKMFLDNSRPGYVRGIVRDFHFESMHNAIRPLVLFTEQRGRWLLVKLTGHNLPRTISSLEAKWKNLVPERPFEYHFMDDDYQKLYMAELRLGKVMMLFSSIAIVLACLGLFGLSSFTAQQHIKEIGVRRILGATVVDIVLNLSGNFIKLTLIAILIAFPLAWWSMTKWLQDFNYRTEIGWVIFVASAGLTLLLAVVTVSIHAIKAAMTNPVKNLRTE
jgi:putative ABC transport system permease protein